MEPPVLTNQCVHSIVQSEVTWMNSRLASIQEQFSDSGTKIARFGNATAFAIQSITSNADFNRTIGLTAQDVGFVEPLLDWFSENGVPCRIDLCPYQADQALVLSLAKHGLYQSHHEMVLYGVPPSRISPLPAHIVVRHIHQQEMDLYSDLYAQGFLEFYQGIDVNLRLAGEYAKIMYGVPGWHLYVAFLEGTPAALALLHIQDQIASLAAGATLPQFRGKGCQTALIQQRIADAAQAGCTLLVTQTRVGTASQRNMERAGFRIAYTRAIWTALEA